MFTEFSRSGSLQHFRIKLSRILLRTDRGQAISASMKVAFNFTCMKTSARETPALLLACHIMSRSCDICGSSAWL
jgi:hypothetical protein